MRRKRRLARWPIDDRLRCRSLRHVAAGCPPVFSRGAKPATANYRARGWLIFAGLIFPSGVIVYKYTHEVSPCSRKSPRKSLPPRCDAVAGRIVEAVDWRNEPIDCLRLARRLGVEVAYDNRQAGRGRIVQLGGGVAPTAESILLRPEPRPERVQWAVAHELGEKFACDVFLALGVDPREAPARRDGRQPVGRTDFAAQRAVRQRCPSLRLGSVPAQGRWSTASHELVARRMLDFEPWIVITVFDNGRPTFRGANRYRRKPPLEPGEIQCRNLVDRSGEAQTVDEPTYRVQVGR